MLLYTIIIMMMMHFKTWKRDIFKNKKVKKSNKVYWILTGRQGMAGISRTDTVLHLATTSKPWPDPQTFSTPGPNRGQAAAFQSLRKGDLVTC
jgi:hypothetical protein